MCVSQLLARALRTVPEGHGRTVNLALSGGVDSSVAGLLLRERGWSIRPVLMRCWSYKEEDDTTSCFERDLACATSAARALNLQEPTVFDLTREYWTQVFEPVFLAGLARNHTPNPDVACNAHVKFGAFPARLRAETSNHQTPPFATGHYARIGALPGILRRAVDPKKDQTYFLATVRKQDLGEAMFPVGGLRKDETRGIAKYAALPAASARSSRGLCFVGKRPLAPFAKQFLPDAPHGRFVDARIGSVIAETPKPTWAYTIGQRARIGGLNEPYFVADKRGDEVLVVPGSMHPKLFVTWARCATMHWIEGSPPAVLSSGTEMSMHAKTYSSAPLVNCTVSLVLGGAVHIKFEHKQRRVAPGQLIALYQGDICLGGGIVSE